MRPILDNPSNEYDKNLAIFKELLNSESDMIIDYLTPEIFEKPLTPFKTEVMMANAEILAPKLYENELSVIFPEVFETKNPE